MAIYFIRHAKVKNNIENTINWWSEDQEISQDSSIDFQEDTFQEQLKSLNIDKIYASKLKRAFQTAEKISDILDYENEIVKDKRINEQDFGEFDWKNIDELLKKYNIDKYELSYLYRTKNWEWESWDFFITRVKAFYKDILEEAKNKNVLIVSHGWVYRALVCLTENKTLWEITLSSYSDYYMQNLEIRSFPIINI